MLWCQLVDPVIKAHKLHHFRVNLTIPPKFTTLDDANANGVSAVYDAWETQHQILAAINDDEKIGGLKAWLHSVLK